MFQSPFAIDIQYEDRPTPSSYRLHPDGVDLGATMPMWRVQTELQGDGSGLPWGLVSTGATFEDSPDAEVIAGGLNTKGQDSVAIGRHGPYMEWGFALAPEHMTEEFQKLFVNAVHYMSRFDGDSMLVRNDHAPLPRKYLKSGAYLLSEAGMAAIAESTHEGNERLKKRQAELQARVDAGESLTDLQQRILQMPEMPVPERGAWLFGVPEKTLTMFENDLDELQRHLESIVPYAYATPGVYEFEVDLDAQALGIPNNDVRLLERCVSDLEAGTNKARAMRLLHRYTTQRFDDAAEWRGWLDENRDRLFFTEFGGYVFRVNTLDDPGPGAAAAPPPVLEVAPTSVAEPVSVAAMLVSQGDGVYELVVQFAIHNGWHVYASVPPSSPYIATVVGADLPEGVTAEGNWTKPAGVPSFGKPGILEIHGEARYSRLLRVAPGVDVSTLEVPVQVRWQACDSRLCRPPGMLTLRVGVE